MFLFTLIVSLATGFPVRRHTRFESVARECDGGVEGSRTHGRKEPEPGYDRERAPGGSGSIFVPVAGDGGAFSCGASGGRTRWIRVSRRHIWRFSRPIPDKPDTRNRWPERFTRMCGAGSRASPALSRCHRASNMPLWARTRERSPDGRVATEIARGPDPGGCQRGGPELLRDRGSGDRKRARVHACRPGSCRCPWPS